MDPTNPLLLQQKIDPTNSFIFFVTPQIYPLSQLKQSVPAAPMSFLQAQASECAMDCSNSDRAVSLLCNKTPASTNPCYIVNFPNIVKLLHILVFFNLKLGG